MKIYASRHQWHLSTIAFALLVGTLFLPLVVNAQTSAEQYTDVSAGVWYEQAADALLGAGALDRSESRLRPNELATRAEVAKLLVMMNDEQLHSPSSPSFTDVPRTAWYYSYMETAARAGWFKGDGNCYGQGRSTCYARPSAPVNRAEMAIILQRAFSLSHAGSAPIFPDNTNDRLWYYLPIQTAADHCILQGDDFSGMVRPAANMNRAEMIVMFHRASMDLNYGEDCGADQEPDGTITGVTAMTSRRVQVTFNVDLDPNRMDDTSAYQLERTSNGDETVIDSVEVINARIVELQLRTALDNNTTYHVMVDNMRTEEGTLFDATRTFVFSGGTAEASIESVTVQSAGVIRVRFSEDVLQSSADDAFRYVITPTGDDEFDAESVIIVNSDTVELVLSTSLQSNTQYRLDVTDLVTDDDRDEFSDSFTFTTSAVESAGIDDIIPLSANRLRIDFTESIDEIYAEDEFRYRINGFGGNVNVSSALAVDGDTVELVLATNLRTQESYSGSVISLRTEDGFLFSDDMSFIFQTSASDDAEFDAILTGAKEIPVVATTATGTGSFTLTSNGLQYDITVKGIDSSEITGAHFHTGDSDEEGPNIETITFNGLRATGTWTNLTMEERADLLNGNIYVNVHTDDHPDGEIRGQVEPD